jgi:ubiquinone biosynthesis accessory factor UbiJ
VVKPSLAFELTLAHLESAMNRALAYSLKWPEYARGLNHTILRCEIPILQQQVFVHIENSFISLSSKGPDQVDLVITATPSALLEMAQSKKAGTNIHISGNAALAQTLQQAIHHLDIDWEGLLADQIGDIPARQASKIFGQLKDFAQRLTGTLLSDTADYWVDETQILPAKHEVDSFYKEVTALRYDTDRLEARIKRLEN